jgi:hypothetical protein
MWVARVYFLPTFVNRFADESILEYQFVSVLLSIPVLFLDQVEPLAPD